MISARIATALPSVSTRPRSNIYLQTGTVDEKVQREMIAVAAQRVKPKELPPPERVFDFSFAQKVSDSLK